jgi:hypothetical protein
LSCKDDVLTFCQWIKICKLYQMDVE